MKNKKVWKRVQASKKRASGYKQARSALAGTSKLRSALAGTSKPEAR